MRLHAAGSLTSRNRNDDTAEPAPAALDRKHAFKRLRSVKKMSRLNGCHRAGSKNNVEKGNEYARCFDCKQRCRSNDGR